ncbi:MAG TPA: hypothetical protein VHM90_03690 [Phycisphaerae bacterium]|nr:hypothetical protein [Phycisphaerae bacterium]
MFWSHALAGAIIFAAAPAFADSLDAGTLPSQTRWVLHIDADGVRQAPALMEKIRQRVVEPQKADLLAKVTFLERITGMQFPQDLHDATLFGTSFDQTGACVRIHATNLNETGITAFLRADAEFSQVDHNGHNVLTWRDLGADRLMYGTFAKRDVILISANIKALLEALDASDAKTPGLKPESPLSPPKLAANTPQPLLWMAGDNLAELPRMQNTESPLLAQMEAASMGVKWINDRALVEVTVTSKNEKVAQEMRAVAEGAKAFLSLMAADEHASARNKLLSNMMQKFGTETDGKIVKGRWELDVNNVDLLLNTIHGEQAAVTAPALVKPANGRP